MAGTVSAASRRMRRRYGAVVAPQPLAIAGHVSGGYRLVRPFRPDAAWAPPRLAGEPVLTVSSCLAPVGPGTWALSWGGDADPAAEAVALGLVPDAVSSAVAWTEAAMLAGGWGWPEVCLSLDAARSFVAACVPSPPADLRLVGIGLPEDLVAACRSDHPLPTDRGVGATALDELVHRADPLAPGGTPLGYEVLGEELGGTFHSWWCHRLVAELEDELNFAVGPDGLIGDLATARAAASAVDGPPPRGEPVPWRPWLLVDYPLA